jgi:nucleoside-triphosphatase
MSHALLLTGSPGIGKTTVIIRLAKGLTGRRIAGFVTEEVRDRRGSREGFVARPFAGGDITIASVQRPGSPRVGKYGVDVGALETLAQRYLAPPDEVDLYLVDEIGKMECYSPSFVKAMTRLLDGPTPLVATVGQRGTGLVAEAKRWPGSRLWHVTRENRDDLPRHAMLWLKASGHL